MRCFGAIEERVHFATVSVDIQKEGSLLAIIVDLLFNPINLRMRSFARILPLPIDVTARNVGSIVAAYYSVYVDHRNYFELEFVSEFLGFLG